MTVGWDSTTVGWDSTTVGWDSGSGAVAVKHGAHEGLTLPYGGPTAHLLDMAEASGAHHVRWGEDINDLMSSDPDSTSAAVTLDLTALQAKVDAVHARTAPDGSPMKCVLGVIGVPRKVNPFAGSADPASGGRYHWFALDGAGRTIVANYTADITAVLDPTLDWMQVGNELNNGSFNHDGTASPGPGAVGANAGTVAKQMAEQILAIRSAIPTQRIMSGSIMNYGDFRNPANAALAAPGWVQAMISGDQRLVNVGGDARPDVWACHAYTGTTAPLNGWTISGGRSVITSGFGWGLPQTLQFRSVLAFAGATAPDDTEPKLAVTEYGTSRLTTSESTQLSFLQQYLYAFEAWKNEGWLVQSDYYTIEGDEKALWRSSGSFAPYQAGTYFTSWAHTDEVTAPPPPPAAPVAHFTFTPSTIQAGHTVAFTDTSTGTPSTWAWTFGDGGTSTLQSPSHLFTTPGTYTVTLVATNAGGSGTVPHTVTVTPTVIVTPPPAPPFTVTIEIGIPPKAASNPRNFVIGDSTRGKLNSTYYIADDYDWIEITGDVQDIATHRGKQRDTDRTEAGTASVVVRNDRVDRGTAGDYDPFSWGSPFFPFLGPRSKMRISVDGVYLFGGDIDDMPVNDIQDNVVVTTFNLVDVLNRLNKPIVYKPEAQHTAAKRLSRIVERAGWELDDTFFYPGINLYQKGIEQSGTALDMCGDVALSEGGLFFASNQGNTLVFLDRAAMADAGYMFTLSDNPAAPLRYSALTRNNGLDILVNKATIHGLEQDEVPGTAQNEQSIGYYGERPLEATLPIASADARAYRAAVIVNDYGVPKQRIESVTVPTVRIPAFVRPFVGGQELGHVIAVERTPPGGVGTITQYCVIIGISHHLAPRMWETTFTLTPQL